MRNGTTNGPCITTLKPSSAQAVIAAVDSSSIKLADSEEGMVFAVKCGVVIASRLRILMHFKIGPMLFYLSESTMWQSGVSDRLAKMILYDSDFASRFVRIRAERSIHSELAKSMTGAIVLIDGSLRSSLFEDREKSLRRISEDCVLNGNGLIGLSKGTKFKILERVASSLSVVSGPAYIDVGPIVKGLVKSALGDNLMVSLSRQRGPALRADVIGGTEGVLSKLLGNDQLNNGYPESLRLAHHISPFTSSEIVCIKSHIINKYGVIELPSEDLRAYLLGSVPV